MLSLPEELKNPENPENLVFEGSGVRGAAYAGALKVIEDQGVLKGIKRVASSSGGGLPALLLALGADANEIRNAMLNKLVITDVMDSRLSWEPKFTLRSTGLKIGLSNLITFFTRKAFFTGKNLRAQLKTIITHTLEKRGVDLSGIINKKQDWGKLTFGQLETLIKKYPNNNFRKLYITATRVSDGSRKVFSADSDPNMPIATAIRMSMGLPGVFEPVEYEGHYYVDGGVADNCPVSIFDQPKFLAKDAKTDNNPRTLVVLVDTQFEIDLRDKNAVLSKNFSFLELFSHLLSCLHDPEKLFREKGDKENINNIIQICDNGVAHSDFSLSREVQIKLMDSGEKAANDFFNAKGIKKTRNAAQQSQHKKTKPTKAFKKTKRFIFKKIFNHLKDTMHFVIQDIPYFCWIVLSGLFIWNIHIAFSLIKWPFELGAKAISGIRKYFRGNKKKAPAPIVSSQSEQPSAPKELSVSKTLVDENKDQKNRVIFALKEARDDKEEAEAIIGLPSFSRPPIESVLFESVGITGIAFVGALKAGEEAGFFKNIKRVGGSAMGGIVATLFAIGYTPLEIEKIVLEEIDFSSLKDGGHDWEPKFLNLKGSKVGMLSLYNAYKNKAIYKGHAANELLQELILKRFEKFPEIKIDPETLTFQQLQNLGNNNDGLNIKDLFLTGTRLSDTSLVEFSAELTPDMPIKDALRIAMSFPPAFPPVEYEGHWYASGSIADIYPMHLFDKHSEDHGLNKAFANPCTLGLVVDSQKAIDSRWGQVDHHEANPSMRSYLWNMLCGMHNRSEVLRDKYNINSVQIHDKDIESFNLDITHQQKLSLIDSGYEYFKNYLALYTGPDVLYHDAFYEKKASVRL